MPSGVNEETWARAKAQAAKQGMSNPHYDQDWAYIMKIYQKMNGADSSKVAGIKDIFSLLRKTKRVADIKDDIQEENKLEAAMKSSRTRPLRIYGNTPGMLRRATNLQKGISRPRGKRVATPIVDSIAETDPLLRAVTALEIARDASSNNAPIYLREGNYDQANIAKESSRSYNIALDILNDNRKVGSIVRTPMLDGIRKEAAMDKNAIYSAKTGEDITRKLWLQAFMNRAKRVIKPMQQRGVDELVLDRSFAAKDYTKPLQRLLSRPQSRIYDNPSLQTSSLNHLNQVLMAKSIPLEWAYPRYNPLNKIVSDVVWKINPHQEYLDLAQPIRRSAIASTLRK